MGGGPILAMASIDALDNLDINVIVVPKVALFAALRALLLLVAAARSHVVRVTSPSTKVSSS